MRCLSPRAELEDLLLKHEDIQDVAVTGLPDESRATEMPLAFGMCCL